MNTQGTLLLDFAHLPLSRQELDTARNCVAGSKHTRLTLLPNHVLDPTCEFEGFVFDCCADDPASVLPITRSTFATTAMYECMADSSVFLHISSDTACATAELVEVVRSVEEDEAEQLKFDVMPDWSTTSLAQLQDQRPWRESVPAKIRVYHAFMRSTAQNTREHKLFIVVSGHCLHAIEELYNLWLDTRGMITSKQFLECAELDGCARPLCAITTDSPRLANRLGLAVRFMHDVDAVAATSAILPTTSCISRDLSLARCRVAVTSEAVLLERGKSGVVFDCFAGEGFWVFMDPRDSGSYRMFGTELRSPAIYTGMPCRTVPLHSLFPASNKANVVGAPPRLVRDLPYDDIAADVSVVYHRAATPLICFLFPHADFVQELAKLGYAINDGITNLMPIVFYCEDE